MKQFLILICLFISCIAPTFSTLFTADEIRKCHQDYKWAFKHYVRPTDFNITQKGTVAFDGGTYRYIVVGAGCAGCAIASKLAEGLPKGERVLVISGGPHASKCSLIPYFTKYLPFSPGSIRFQSAANSQCFKGYKGHKINIDSSSNVGGSCTCDNMDYYKIAADEVKELAKLIKDASWPAKLREEMRLMESTSIPGSFDDSSSSCSDDEVKCHGEDGILSTVYNNYQTQCATEFLKSSGKPPGDLNCGKLSGSSKIQLISRNGLRVNIPDCFNITNNRNIVLIDDAMVTKIKFGRSGRKSCDLTARGIYYVSKKDGKQYKVRAEEAVVISAGSVYSPNLLQKSGIGKSDDLAARNIHCKQNLPVGGNQTDKAQVRVILNTKIPPNVDITNHDITKFLSTFTGILSCPGPQGTRCVNFRSTSERSIPDVQYTISAVTMDNVMKETLNLKEELFEEWSKICKPNCFMVTITVLNPKVQISTTLSLSSNQFAFPDVRYTCSKEDRDTLARGMKNLEENILSHFPSTLQVDVPVQIPSLCDNCDKDNCIRRFVEHTMNFQGDITGGCNMGTVTDSNGKVKGTCNLYVADSSSWPKPLRGYSASTLLAYARLIGEGIRKTEASSSSSCSSE